MDILYPWKDTKDMESLATMEPMNTAALFPRIGFETLQHYEQRSERSVEEQLNAIFPEQTHKNKLVKRTKEILGDLTSGMSEDEVQTIATEVEYLCETWLDRYEEKIFSGKTLNELLNIG